MIVREINKINGVKYLRLTSYNGKYIKLKNSEELLNEYLTIDLEFSGIIETNIDIKVDEMNEND